MNFPTADDIAFAIVLAAREYGEDPFEIATGKFSARARSVVITSLEICFPEADAGRIARCAGGERGVLSSFRKGWPGADRRIAYQKQWKIAGEIAARRRKLGLEPLHVDGLPGAQLHMRREVVRDAAALPPDHYGDPGPGRSALDQREKE